MLSMLSPRQMRVTTRAFASAAAPRAFASAAAPRPLEGQFAWIIGGAGAVGAGLARSLLDAGATVLVNSRRVNALATLSKDLDDHDRLIGVPGSMLPESAEETVAAVMNLTAYRLDHVIAHSAVRWWAADGGDETSTLTRRDSLLHVPPAEFSSIASQLSGLHYAAAHHLTPLMSHRGGSFTFVTSNADGAWGPRSSVAQINAHSVMGLASAMRSEMEGSTVRVSELRLGPGMRLNRPSAERESDPREKPLSQDIGRVVAGIVARGDSGLLQATDKFEFEMLKQKYAIA